ncbi:TOMM precursor leader peptide-binding protein [Nannocystis bainbridge]|uniref:TOMM leader peptide-binding protein n=1 Tax=Nannocystis bainbridge TaxID=2995303 RepID=A0ABT5DWJ5_9BACT|nr:TOMM precursor leader peptide-binding protein [Nannocystis bainbridge]MDC0717523.1 TOMM precursor leader peptide-binding protein [Nannocystis bainbridge]
MSTVMAESTLHISSSEDVTAAEVRRRLRGARILLVGLDPWGVAAAVDLAAAGVGALHILDDAQVSEDDLAAEVFPENTRGLERAAALCATLRRIAPECAATWKRLSVAAHRPLLHDDGRWDLVIACVAADELLVLQSVARYAHAARAPSLSAHMDGLDAVIGPAVIPGETACWECHRLRRLAHTEEGRVEHALQTTLLSERPQPRRRTCLASMPALVGHAAALAAINLLVRGSASRFAGAVVVQNLVELESSLHSVLRMPWCEICGGAHAARANDRSAGDAAPRLDAARTPEELRRMLVGVVDARVGIVRQVEMDLLNPVNAPDLPITATAVLGQYTDGHYRSSHCGVPKLGSGKGSTLVEAMIGAVGEAVERYSAGRFRARDLLRTAVGAMTGGFIAPERLCLYSDDQYARPGFPYARLDPRTPIDWTLGHWLGTSSVVAVPALPVYYNYPAPPESHFCQVTSNGLAAGAELEDASLRAALELVERDAFMISWLARRPGRRLRLNRPLDPVSQEILRQLAERGVRVELYLLDVGLAVPVVMSVGHGDGVRWPGATVALAAHLSPRNAIRKSILEQAHVGPYLHRLMISGSVAIPERPEDVHTLDEHAHYYFPPSRASAFAFLGAGGTIAASDLEEPEDLSLAGLVRRIEAAGLRVAVVDVTSPDLAPTPFRVVRAVGPDFQQIHFGHLLARLGNPRLAAMASQGINPDPHPMA